MRVNYKYHKKDIPLMETDSMKLYMPFDESQGSVKAFDYSNSRADGILSGGVTYESGKNGNCIQFDGSGTVEVQKSVLDLSKPFTIMGYMKLTEAANTVIMLLNYAGVEQYCQILITLSAGVWYGFALTYSNGTASVYINNTLVTKTAIDRTWGNPTGVSVAQACYNTELGKGCLDDVKMFNAALTPEELIQKTSVNKKLAYLLDGVDFKEYGVSVSGSSGLLDALKMKEPMSVEFDGYHGVAVDLSRPRFQQREITLECFIKIDGTKLDFINAVKKFMEALSKKHVIQEGMTCELMPAGLHELIVDIHPTKPLIYMVYLADGAAVEKTWNDKRMVGTFSLKLIEPEPVKKVIKHLCLDEETAVTYITLSTAKRVNIYWGDGTMDSDISGNDIKIKHRYAANGDYFIVITGVIESIAKTETNDIIIWEKL